MNDRVLIRKLPSGVPGLDEVLGGGIPEFSFNLIAGGPGCGKTTLGHQIMFANATPERKAVYFTIIGEPPLKMLRYQQQYGFFDATKVGDESVRFIHLGQQVLEGGMARVLEAVVKELEESNPAIVVVDSFRSMVRGALAGQDGESEVANFMQRLALVLTSHEATTFLLGEYADGEHDPAVFTVAWSSRAPLADPGNPAQLHGAQGASDSKLRGQAQLPGLHTALITEAGFGILPRIIKREIVTDHPTKHRLKTGVPGLDEMLDGGIPNGYAVLVAGPAGSGKTVLANQFIVEGINQGENGLVAVFEKRPSDYLQSTPRSARNSRAWSDKKLEVLYLRPLDLSIDEVLLELRHAVKTRRAARSER